MVPETFIQVSVVQGPLRGIHLYLNLHREKAFWFGIYETWVQNLMSENLKEGRSCLGRRGLLRIPHTVAVQAVRAGECSGDRTRSQQSNTPRQELATQWLRGDTYCYIGRRGCFRTALSSEALRRSRPECGWEFRRGRGRRTSLDLLLDEYGPPALVKVDIEGAEDRCSRAHLASFKRYAPSESLDTRRTR